MKRFIYSGFTKFAAVILFMAGIVAGTLIAADGIMIFFSYDEIFYHFESVFSETQEFLGLLDVPENAVYNAYHSTYGRKTDHERVLDQKILTLNRNIAPGYQDKINYYIQRNKTIITNCGAKDPTSLLGGDFYSYVRTDGEGNIERVSTDQQHAYRIEDLQRFDPTSIIVISCNVKAEYVEVFKAAWEEQRNLVFDTAEKTLLCLAAALFLLIFLVYICGKNAEGEYVRMWIDCIWTEIHLAGIAGSVFGLFVGCAKLLDRWGAGDLQRSMTNWMIGFAAALGSLIFITLFLSIIRKIKTGRLIRTSIVFLILKSAFSGLKWVVRILMKMEKSSVILVGILFVYTSLIVLLGVWKAVSPLWLIPGGFIFGFACWIGANRIQDFVEIKKGIGEVRRGNASYKIPDLKCEDMRSLAENINDITKGLDESVAAKVKAERLRTELITNVSHDLKTPITSIISYTELLSEMEDLPDDARDYVSVIVKKSYRLKQLTQDLFDISKVQSGNDDVVLEKIDTALLISQLLAEHDNEIQNSALLFCVDAPKELYIVADGLKISRVLDNLISNILKYSMKSTRVFISTFERDGIVAMEFKNISAYPLDFNAEEITQRFVRGDLSRSEEGNGLGLAIAKSYTEACGGVFEISIDGDMFKAILKFRKYSE